MAAPVKVGINGFGRIGRLVFRALVDQGLLGSDKSSFLDEEIAFVAPETPFQRAGLPWMGAAWHNSAVALGLSS